MIEFGKTTKQAVKRAPFLISAEEDEDNVIRFVVALCAAGEEGAYADDMGIPALGEILKKCRPLEPDENNMYEIIFEGYIMHQITNESFDVGDDTEIRCGDYFVMIEKSRFLDYCNMVTIKELTRDMKQYGIYCQNHIIDIISQYPPTIRKIQAETESS